MMHHNHPTLAARLVTEPFVYLFHAPAKAECF